MDGQPAPNPPLVSSSEYCFADVAVDAAPNFLNTFSYRIPSDMHLQVGQAVWVPFGSRTARGVVFRLTRDAGHPQVRDVLETIGLEPVMSPARIAIAAWLSDQYICPPFVAASPFLGSDFGQRVRTYVEAVSAAKDDDLNHAEQRVLKYLRVRGSRDRDFLIAHLRGIDAAGAIDRLLRRGLAQSKERLEKPAAGPAEDRWVVPTGLESRSRGARRQALVERLRALGPSRISELVKARPSLGSDVRGLVKALEAEGVVKVEARALRRDPLAGRIVPRTEAPVLSNEQARVWQTLAPSLNRSRPFLLHGVTGSGKTEIYLRALDLTVQLGRRGIVLVPEISLTPQAIDRFAGRYPGRVGLIHSRLTAGERFDEWTRIRKGEVDVVVGSRSALFAPLPEVGLIVVDEEHEWSYKQADPAPRYQARDLAIEMGRQLRAAVILGSATPDLATYQDAIDGRIGLLEMRERVVGGPPPPVRVVDMRIELKVGNRSMFSRQLQQAIATVLARGQQAILYLNRRGTASVVLCRDCGYTARCRRCETVLSYHADRGDLVCHTCNTTRTVPKVCPDCDSRRIRYLGAGTQKVVEEVGKLFPTARIMRLDSDVAGGARGHDQVLADFSAGQADVLVGTQILAKGHDIPSVSLVGVMNADVGLYLPDFRAPERVFQLLTQVAGRPGRRGGGLTIIQTYSPDHYVVRAVARHDYRSFFDHEIAHRREQDYPPFNRIARLLYRHHDDQAAFREATRLRAQLVEARTTSGVSIDVLGPAPAFFRRIRGFFRWQIIVRGDDVVSFLRELKLRPGWVVDVDPISLL